MLERCSALVFALLCALLTGACSGPPADASGPGDAAGGGDAGGTADAAHEASPAFPAFQPAMPQIQKGAGTVLAAPVVVPVYFGGETLQSTLDATVSSWLVSSAFRTSLQEYGVTSGTAGSSIALAEAAAASLTDTDVEAWLKGKLDGTHPEFGPVDAATLGPKIFVLYYPASTTITRGTPPTGAGAGCGGWTGYHAGVALAGNAVAHYAVLARCTPVSGSALDLLTSTATAMIVSEATNPQTSLTTYQTGGWTGFDAAHAVFALNDEVGSACEEVAPVTPPGVAGAVTRIWSNVAAAAYHDPCRPAPSDPYFVAVPVLTDDIVAGSVHTKGVVVPRGGSVTIDVQLLSDGPTDAWDLSMPMAGGMEMSFDQPTGRNGDTRKLTIHSGSDPPMLLVGIASGRNQQTRSFWDFLVQTK
jgi:hypothetical protein